MYWRAGGGLERDLRREPFPAHGFFGATAPGLLIERARGLKIPPDDMLDAEVDAIAGDYHALMRLMARQAGNAAKFIRDIFRLIQSN
jgi:hypothetical protein